MNKNVIKIPNINDLNNGMKFRISSLYGEIAKKNFKEYKKSMNIVKKSMKKFEDGFSNLISMQDLIENKELVSAVMNYDDLIENDLSNYEKILDSPRESINFINLILNNIDFKEEDIKEILPDPSSFNNTLKSGVIAIAFEAFACEALINEELLQITSKNQMNKISKSEGRSYINKLEAIIHKTENDISNFESLKNKIIELMSIRNKIVHLKEYKYDPMKLIKYLDSDDLSSEDDMYIGELIHDIMNFENTYLELCRKLEV